MIDETIEEYSKIYLADDAVHDNWDLNGMREYFLGWITTPEDLHFTPEEPVSYTHLLFYLPLKVYRP